LFALAADAGTNRYALEQCVADKATADQVRRDIELARQLSLSSTPAFVIGRRLGDRLLPAKVVVGAQPAALFKAAIAFAEGNVK
jgi:protein-disulfide isomerase